MTSKLALVLSLILITKSTLSQTPSNIWGVAYNNLDFDQASTNTFSGDCLRACADGGYLLGGYMFDGSEPYAGYGENDMYILKANEYGWDQWSIILGGSGYDIAHGIWEASNGDIIVLGITWSNDVDVSGNHGMADVWVVRLTSTGDVIWKKCFGGAGEDFLYGSTLLTDGSIVFIGTTNSTNGDLLGAPNDDDADADTWIVKLTGNGTISWQKRLNNDIQIGSFSAFTSTLDGGFAYSAENGSMNLVKLDAAANIEWTREVEGTNEDLERICQSTTGNFAIASTANTTDNFSVLRIYSPTGDLLWTRYFDGDDEYEYVKFIKPSWDGGFILGLFNVFKLDAQGYTQWQINNYSTSAIQLSENSYVLSGIQTSNISLAYYGEPEISVASYSWTVDCLGEDYSVSFQDEIGFGPSYCEVEISDIQGNFDNPVVIGSGYVSPIICSIPANITPGEGYQIRVTKPQLNVISPSTYWPITIVAPQNFSFSESMGVVPSTTAVAVHEAANGFDNDSQTMTGTANVGNGSGSAGEYTGASGGSNVNMLTADTFFEIAGINTTGVQNAHLSFGHYKSNSFGISAAMTVKYSTDGINYTSLSYSVPVFSSGWSIVNIDAELPQAENLRLQFTTTSLASGTIRIDDISINGEMGLSAIQANGPVNWCGVGSVILTAPNAETYVWSTGATTKSITVNTAGTYSCIVTTSSGCVVELDPINVTTTSQLWYRDTDHDGYGGTSAQLCAPNATYTILVGGDCDDENDLINPQGIEICNGLDDNCDGQIDENMDKDGDGYSACDGDCNDDNPYIHPGAPDIQNNMDDNCDGLIDNPVENIWYEDADSDGYGNPLYVSNLPNIPAGYVANALDCDDEDASRFPTAEDTCGDNIDNNCDGIVDNCPIVTCMGDLDNNGTVNVSDLLLFTSAFGSSCD